MKIGYRMLAFGLAMVLAVGLPGCGKEEEASQTEQTQQTTQATEPSNPEISEKEIDHLLNGLYISLAESISVTTQDDQLAFENDEIQGGVTFKTLSSLPEDTARTSEGYAQQLLSHTKDENSEAWMGTSTGVGYYVVIPSAEKTEVRGLYVWDNVCWEVWAESTDPELQDQLIRIVGRCYIKENKIPQIEE